jgi:hypothetical protein
MQRAAAARADHAVDIDQNILTRQMIGQRLATRRSFGRRLADELKALLDACDVSVEFFQRKCKLSGIEPLRAAAELRPLQLLMID